MRRSSPSSTCARASARPGSPGSTARTATGATGWRWIGSPGTAGEDRVGGVADEDDTDRQPSGGFERSRAEGIRALVDQALGATQGARGVPMRELADELAGAA